jgi:uncharacterized membrane protein YeaQ/YmgE (transglycosylase-associated protein family)
MGDWANRPNLTEARCEPTQKQYISPARDFRSFIESLSKRVIMFHLIWYILIGLIAGVIAKSVMHVHLTLLWTTVLGIIGSIIGGAVTHMFAPPRDARFHPAGLIFSTLGAILILFVCYKLKIRFPHV